MHRVVQFPYWWFAVREAFWEENFMLQCEFTELFGVLFFKFFFSLWIVQKSYCEIEIGAS
jgi:hypothetical protein